MNDRTAVPHNWKDGLKRIPLHLFAFGLPVAISAHWLGWISLGFAAGFASREVQDFQDGSDTLGKAAIDFASQIALPLLYLLAVHAGK